jgi:hypothetical protein
MVAGFRCWPARCRRQEPPSALRKGRGRRSPDLEACDFLSFETNLVISHGIYLGRDDFTRYVHTAASVSEEGHAHPDRRPAQEIDLPNGSARFMRTVRALIGTDCAERFWITDQWEAWLDEDGMAAGKPVNQAATLLAQSFGWHLTLRGITVIVGLSDEAALVALSPDQVNAIFRLTGSAP